MQVEDIQNVHLLLSYNQVNVCLPHLFYNSFKHFIELKVTIDAELITTLGIRKWTKKFPSIYEAVHEACRRWQKKIESKTYVQRPVPDLLSSNIVFQTEIACYTLHPTQNADDRQHMMVIWKHGVRRLHDNKDGVFFLDPISYENVERCKICLHDKQIVLVYYKNPYLFVYNGFKDKHDPWNVRLVELERVIENVNNDFFRMQPTIICENAEEIELHMQEYKKSNITNVEIRNTQAPFGKEILFGSDFEGQLSN